MGDGGGGGGGIMVITVCFLKRDKWTLYLYSFLSCRKCKEDQLNDFSQGENNGKNEWRFLVLKQTPLENTPVGGWGGVV
jgi:hypothetical protein